MNKTLLFFFFFCTTAVVFSQNYSRGSSGNVPKTKAPIELYQIVSADRDTTVVDTSLTIAKDYKFNYLRRDDFELMPFVNVGQTYNSLGYSFDKSNLKPLFVAQSHHFNYMEIEDMQYFRVPTPLTELYFRTAFEQGQQLDAFLTVNTSEQFNFSIAYKGVRSLGNYQQMLTSTGNFRFTTNYHTKNKRYKVRAHVAAQDILNQENGGLNANSIALFEAADPEFEDRGRLDVNFENAENKLEGLRFYADHEYEIISQRDSTSYNVLNIGNRISYEDKFFEYRQNAPFSGFGESYESSDLLKKTKLEDFNVEGYARLENSILGEIGAFIGYTDYNYGYNTVLELAEGRITNRLKGNIVQFGASYKKQYRGFELSGNGKINIAGDFDGNYLNAAASFSFNEENKVRASATIHSVAPNFNFLLYQSDYVNYNWQNSFENVKTQELKFEMKSKKLLDATVSYTGIDDYTYFAVKANDSTPTPQQFDERVDYLKVKAEREFRYGRFALMNTVMFQQAVSGEEVFNVPEIVIRHSLYYEDEWFKKALFLQTGITVKYFTEYNMNAYDPVLAEFYVQNNEKLGAFPLVDLFFNAKIKQTRIYFKYEHINQLFNSSNSHFSAPGYPYRDAVIRFGLVWNFFL
ncbi:MAG: putative porin [Bacteroidia bacterium]|nr:putative porin [Bacteroidia bacterium]NNF32343.1 putative porin [Flavobacteriaceae bacterium]MBT8276326.1 putative porin [Bacteroidia bacterium]NNJ82105.1 putative porin [Flavobacteriaceae bacterium]NNK53219.1 putative porin [Flavobacteriaceae bacterium]